MPHQDRRAGGARLNSADLLQALQSLSRGVDWSAVRLRAECSWSCCWLAWTAILWAWSNEATLLERFACAQRLIRHLQGAEPKPPTSYQAFLKLLRRWTADLVSAWQTVLRRQMSTLDEERWMVHGFVAFGTDGSKIELPRTTSNQEAYAHSRQHSRRDRRRKPHDRAATKKTEQPQLFLTTMFHVGLHLPYDWRIGPADSSERSHALDMLGSLPETSLLTADAGFVGYDFVRAVLAAGCELLVRVGSNVTLLKKLGHVRETQGTVYLWPDKASQRNSPPLVFRLVVAAGPRHPVYLITSVLNHTVLTDSQVRDLYRARWGIEVWYRHLKQTFGRRKLRSHNAENARVELEWSIMGLWAVGLVASRELTAQNIPLERLSMAQALAAIRRTARDYLHPCGPPHRLRTQLRHSLLDEYARNDKTSRDYPRKKREHPAGPPIITPASRQQIQQARTIKEQLKKG